MTAHKHYEMIVAKAANMELVVFVKGYEDQDKWREYSGVFPEWIQNFDYFLCPPQHKEVCLHWLNGGDVLLRDFHEVVMESALESFAHRVWSESTVFMDEDVEICIKPRKEKRWIAKIKGRNMLASNGLYTSQAEAASVCGDCDFYEIEVEV